METSLANSDSNTNKYDQSDIQTKSHGGVLISRKYIVTCAKCLQDFYEEKLSWTLVIHFGFQKISPFFIVQQSGNYEKFAQK